MIDPNDKRFLFVPNSPYVVLAGDSALSKWAMESGDIRGEKYIANLPCVKALNENDLAIDCGAFIGDTVLIFQDRGCKVLAIEPYEDAFLALKHNCPKAICIHAAAGDGRPMQPTDRNGEGGSNAGCRMVEAGGDVPTFRIDDLNLAKLTFLKIDTEGSESLVISGARETILRCRPKILFECYTKMLAIHGFTRDDLLNQIWALGYNISVAIGRASDERVDFLGTPTEMPLI